MIHLFLSLKLFWLKMNANFHRLEINRFWPFTGHLYTSQWDWTLISYVTALDHYWRSRLAGVSKLWVLNRDWLICIQCKIQKRGTADVWMKEKTKYFVVVNDHRLSKQKGTGTRFSKVPIIFWVWKAISNTPTGLLCKACLFISCKGYKNWNKIMKFCVPGPLRFEDAKRLRSREMRPKSFGTFEKRASGLPFPCSSLPFFLLFSRVWYE